MPNDGDLRTMGCVCGASLLLFVGPGINNLTEGNSVVQQEISNLEFVKVLDDPAMKAKGLQAEMDPTTGRPQFVRHA